MFLEVLMFSILTTAVRSNLSASCTISGNESVDNIDFKQCNDINFEVKNVSLNQALHVSGIQMVSLKGINTTITCAYNSGIYFNNTESIEIRFIKFQKCGILHSYQYDDSFTVNFQSALYFYNIAEIILYSLTITESIGAGLVIFNCRQVQISKSTFSNNSWQLNSSLNSNPVVAGGGGVHVEMSCGSDARKLFDSVDNCNFMNLTITNCSFLYNHAKNLTDPLPKDFGEKIFTSFGKGGGLCIHFRDDTINNTATIMNCTFKCNSAKYGGGAEVVLSNGAKSNEILIRGCTFINNRAVNSSGGLDIGFVGEEINNNNITVSLTIFMNNSAMSGGAVALFFLYSSIHEMSSIIFSDVQWIGNSAHYGAVLFAYPLRTDKASLEPRVQLSYITAINNSVYCIPISNGARYLGEGIIMTTRQSLEFSGNVLFQNNNATCIYATSSIIYFHGIFAEFVQNSATYGAGLTLIGFSSVSLGENTSVIFCNNSVSFAGSAIYYYSIDKTSYIYSRFCFIQMPSSKSTIRIYLLGNKSPINTVHSEELQNISSIIYATTYSSCILKDFKELTSQGTLKQSDTCPSCLLKHVNTRSKSFINDSNRCIDSVSINVSVNMSNVICDSGIVSTENEIELSNTTIEFIPGIVTHLPINVISYLSRTCGHHYYSNSSSIYDFNSNSSSFYVSIKNIDKSRIETSRSHIHTKSISSFLLTGQPGDKGELILTETGFRKLQLTLNITAIECPPLFKINSYNKCECLSASEVPHREFHICDSSQAKLRLGFWIGYGKNATNNTILLISHCPPGFCNKSVDNNNYLHLPNTFDYKGLNRIICHNREGILCGMCQSNYAVFFHATSMKCKKTGLCYLGPLFYFLSEIVPLTILFLVVIYFDIRFTSGNLNGFIFFAQMYNSITQIGTAFVEKSSQYYIVSAFHRIIYRFFDFDFFSSDHLSFCLFHTRTALAVVAFKYVTVLYALLLVFGMVWFLNKFGTKLKCMGMRQFKYSALQGLSAFLVIVYSQCVQVSFMILNFTRIYKDDNSSQFVPFLQGNVKYFSREHLAYAIPAMFCILTIVILLPMLLLFYPLAHKFTVLLRMDQNCAIKFISKWFPISKLKPLLDSLQGSFKDEFRFFAGLYFVYRVVIIATTIQESIEWIHIIIEIELICILGVHMVVWPYQKRLHNIIDALIFCNLTLIVIFKHFTFIIAEKGKQFNKEITRLHLVQLFLINAPLFVILLKIIHYAFIKIRRVHHMGRKKKDQQQIAAQSVLDDNILEDNPRVGSIGNSYMLMRERRLEAFQD